MRTPRKSPRKINQQNFASYAREVHGDRYDYSRVIYKRASSRIEIICPDHGLFEQFSNTHLRGHHCPKCASQRTGKSSRKEQDTFIREASSRYEGKYDYSEFEYTTALKKSTIICPLHGRFSLSPNQHLRNRGCPHCGKLNAHKSKRIHATRVTLEYAIEKWKGKYDYSHIPIDYGVSEKLTLQCPTHGPFSISLNNHKRTGCGRCGKEASPGWYNRKKLAQFENEKGHLYLIELTSQTEKFYKIGITKLDFETRFSEISRLYAIRICRVHQDRLPVVKKIEDEWKRMVKPYQYRPLVRFGGYTECYKIPEEEMYSIMDSLLVKFSSP